MPSVIMLNVTYKPFVLNVVMLNVVRLNVVMLSVVGACCLTERRSTKSFEKIRNN
jgi:hypothetical protein